MSHDLTESPTVDYSCRSTPPPGRPDRQKEEEANGREDKEERPAQDKDEQGERIEGRNDQAARPRAIESHTVQMIARAENSTKARDAVDRGRDSASVAGAQSPLPRC